MALVTRWGIVSKHIIPEGHCQTGIKAVIFIEITHDGRKYDRANTTEGYINTT